MEYDKLNLQDKAKYHFNKFKVDFDSWDCLTFEPKENCRFNRLEELKQKHIPDNERAAGIYNKLCTDYSNRIDC